MSLEFVGRRKFDWTFTHSLKHISCLHFRSKLIPFPKPVKAPLRDHIPCFIIGDAIKSVVEITKKDNHISFCQLRPIFIGLIFISLPLLQYAYINNIIPRRKLANYCCEHSLMITYTHCFMQLDRCSRSCSTTTKEKCVRVSCIAMLVNNSTSKRHLTTTYL